MNTHSKRGADTTAAWGCLQGVAVAVVGVAWSFTLIVRLAAAQATGPSSGSYLLLVVLSVPALLGIGVGIYVAASAWRRDAQSESMNRHSTQEHGPTRARGCLLAVAVTTAGVLLSFILVMSIVVIEPAGMPVGGGLMMVVLSIPALAGVVVGIYIAAFSWEGGR